SPPFHIFHQQTRKGVRSDITQPPDRLLDQPQAFLRTEERPFSFVRCHRHHDMIKKLGRTVHQIQMAIGKRVETARVDHRSHFATVSGTCRLPISKCRGQTVGGGRRAEGGGQRDTERRTLNVERSTSNVQTSNVECQTTNAERALDVGRPASAGKFSSLFVRPPPTAWHLKLPVIPRM